MKADGVNDLLVLSLRTAGYAKNLKLLVPGMRPDLSVFKNGILYCLEYERSSRGMGDHAVAYHRYAEHFQVPVRLLFVDSPSHRKDHRRDYDNASYVCSKLKEPNLTVNIHPTPIATLEDLKSIWQGFLDC